MADKPTNKQHKTSTLSGSLIRVIACCLLLQGCSVSVQGIHVLDLGGRGISPEARTRTDPDQEKIDRTLGPRPRGTGVVILAGAGLFLLSAAITVGGVYAGTRALK